MGLRAGSFLRNNAMIVAGIALLLGASTLALCVGLERMSHRAVTPFWCFSGSVGFLAGLFETVGRTPLEPLFLTAACGGIFLSTYVRSRTLLLVSTVGILSYISYFRRNRLATGAAALIALSLGAGLPAYKEHSPRPDHDFWRCISRSISFTRSCISVSISSTRIAP